MNYIAVVVIVCLIAGCKPQAISNLETLDNLYDGGDLISNRCSGRDPATIPPDEGVLADRIIVKGPNKSILRQELNFALTSVPRPIQEYFRGINGSIIITDDPGDLRQCRGRTPGQNYQAVYTACYLDGLQTKTPHLSLMIEAKPEAILTSTVRLFGYVLSDIMPRIVLKDGNIGLRKEPVSVRFGKEDLTLIFLSEVLKNDRQNAREFIRRYFPEKVSIEIAERIEGIKDIDDLDYKNVYASVSEKFGNSFELGKHALDRDVFADSFDSAFCNTWADGASNTMVRFKNRFTLTADFFPSAYNTIISAIVRNATAGYSDAEFKQIAEVSSDSSFLLDSSQPFAPLQAGNPDRRKSETDFYPRASTVNIVANNAMNAVQMNTGSNFIASQQARGPIAPQSLPSGAYATPTWPLQVSSEPIKLMTHADYDAVAPNLNSQVMAQAGFNRPVIDTTMRQLAGAEVTTDVAHLAATGERIPLRYADGKPAKIGFPQIQNGLNGRYVDPLLTPYVQGHLNIIDQVSDIQRNALGGQPVGVVRGYTTNIDSPTFRSIGNSSPDSLRVGNIINSGGSYAAIDKPSIAESLTTPNSTLNTFTSFDKPLGPGEIRVLEITEVNPNSKTAVFVDAHTAQNEPQSFARPKTKSGVPLDLPPGATVQDGIEEFWKQQGAVSSNHEVMVAGPRQVFKTETQVVDGKELHVIHTRPVPAEILDQPTTVYDAATGRVQKQLSATSTAGGRVGTSIGIARVVGDMTGSSDIGSAVSGMVDLASDEKALQVIGAEGTAAKVAAFNGRVSQAAAHSSEALKSTAIAQRIAGIAQPIGTVGSKIGSTAVGSTALSVGSKVGAFGLKRVLPVTAVAATAYDAYRLTEASVGLYQDRQNLNASIEKSAILGEEVAVSAGFVNDQARAKFTKMDDNLRVRYETASIEVSQALRRGDRASAQSAFADILRLQNSYPYLFQQADYADEISHVRESIK